MIEYKKSDFTETDLNFIQGNSNWESSLKEWGHLNILEYIELGLALIISILVFVTTIKMKYFPREGLLEGVTTQTEIYEQILHALSFETTASSGLVILVFVLFVCSHVMKSICMRGINQLIRIRSEILSGVAKLVD